MGVGGQHHAPTAFPLEETPSTQHRGQWAGPRAGRSHSPHHDAITLPSSSQSVATPTTLLQPTKRSISLNLYRNSLLFLHVHLISVKVTLKTANTHLFSSCAYVFSATEPNSVEKPSAVNVQFAQSETQKNKYHGFCSSAYHPCICQ